ncbi:ADP-ribosylglycohydrolase family protein [Phytoactinopolyspora endophytica]|uniref:ADP-ribosylglycohydrolase family protein n=1 Tax=Phytoactinopolyspora endophytica TaxID=1642495 RepID=UPI00101DA3DA|nr:ADP-ribosylglycohydrolase family protein [Phytoactinopolyspora endophytica]
MPSEDHNVPHNEASDARFAGRYTGADRAAGAILGLAIGDAAGWPARQHRSHRLPAWTRRLRRELDVFAETQDVTSLPVPFALNQDPEPLRFGPSDDAEWSAWTLTWLLRLGAADQQADAPTWSREQVHSIWLDAVETDTVPRGRISVATAADSLRKGVRPPRSGYDNPHHFDDAAAIRAVAIGSMLDSPDLAADVAEWDAEVTNAGDGLYAARAIARAIASSRLLSVTTDERATPAEDEGSEGRIRSMVWRASATTSSSEEEPLGGEGNLPSLPAQVERGGALHENLLRELPENTLIGRTTRAALDAVAGTASPAEAVPLLDDVVDRVYSYGTAAAQTVAVASAMAVVAVRAGAPSIDAVTAAACLPSLADSAPALTGALVGAAHGASSFPDSWVRRCRVLVGCCAPALAGVDLLELMKGNMGEQ